MSIAKERYKVDRKAIALNAVVSGTSSLTMGGIMEILTSVPTQQLPVLMFAFFLAQVLPKIAVEYNKRYQRVKAERKAFKDGRSYKTETFHNSMFSFLLFEVFVGLDKATYF